MIAIQSAHLKDAAAKLEDRVLVQSLSFAEDGVLHFIVGVCTQSGEPLGIVTSYKSVSIKVWKNQTHVTRLGLDLFPNRFEALTTIPLETSSSAFIQSFVELYEIRKSVKDENPQLEYDRLKLVERIEERLSEISES